MLAVCSFSFKSQNYFGTAQFDLTDHADIVSGADKNILTLTQPREKMNNNKKKSWVTIEQFSTTSKTVFQAHYHIDILYPTHTID